MIQRALHQTGTVVRNERLVRQVRIRVQRDRFLHGVALVTRHTPGMVLEGIGGTLGNALPFAGRVNAQVPTDGAGRGVGQVTSAETGFGIATDPSLGTGFRAFRWANWKDEEGKWYEDGRL